MLVPSEGMSMVVNPQHPEIFCVDESLFYIRNIFHENWFLAKASVFTHEVGTESDFHIYNLDSTAGEYDTLPPQVVENLLDILRPNRLDDDLPEYLDQCDIESRELPSIRFQFVDADLVQNQSEFVNIGSIVYEPNDYLEQLEGHRCRVKIRKSTNVRFGLNFISEIAIHFGVIRNLNTRFENFRVSISLCIVPRLVPMNYYYLFFPILHTYATIIPVHVTQDTVSIRLTNGQGNEEEFTVNTMEALHMVHSQETSPSLLLGGIRLSALPTIGQSVLALAPQSNIHENIANGVMLVPSRQMSLIVDPNNAQDFCQDGSLFYVNHIVNQNYVLAKASIILGDELAGSQSDMHVYHIDSASGEYDNLPSQVIDKLLDVLVPIRLNDDLPEYLEDCDGNRVLPSIRFQFLRLGLIQNQSGFIHEGDIVYGPQDYLEHTGDGRCRFKIREASPERFGLNFISKIAIHFKREEIGFCDPKFVH
jgi:hypothetical protein